MNEIINEEIHKERKNVHEAIYNDSKEPKVMSTIKVPLSNKITNNYTVLNQDRVDDSSSTGRPIVNVDFTLLSEKAASYNSKPTKN